MPDASKLNDVKNYFSEKLKVHGATHLGVDYNSVESQERRFFELIKVIDSRAKYSLLDFGCIQKCADFDSCPVAFFNNVAREVYADDGGVKGGFGQGL